MKKFKTVKETIYVGNDYSETARWTLTSFELLAGSKWGLQVLRDEDTLVEPWKEFG